MYITYVLIIINSLCFVLQLLFNQYNIYNFFGLNIFFLTNKLYWQPISSMFMHGSFQHLFMNMANLYIFGYMLERYIGKIRFLSLYLIGGILTSLFSFLVVYYEANQGEFVNVIGASGAICVLFGFGAYFEKRDIFKIFVLLCIISLVPMIVGINIAWFSHLIGFVIGLIYAIYLKKFFNA